MWQPSACDITCYITFFADGWCSLCILEIFDYILYLIARLFSLNGSIQLLGQTKLHCTAVTDMMYRTTRAAFAIALFARNTHSSHKLISKPPLSPFLSSFTHLYS